MNAARGDKIAEVLKNTDNLRKSLKLPTGTKVPNAPVSEPKNSVGQPVQGSGFIKILVYVIAGILSVALILPSESKVYNFILLSLGVKEGLL